MSFKRELFESFLNKNSILTDPEDLTHYGKDSLSCFEPKPSAVLLPESVEQVQEIVKTCAENQLKIVPSGGRTGYTGGATALHQEVILSLERLNKILEIDPQGLNITCQAGVTTAKVQEEANKNNLLYPVDFASSGSSQIGGNIATNAGGINVIRYGLTRNWVLGIKVVLADGSLLDCSSSLIKNQSGYDLKHFFIGSEGTLGIIVEATLRLSAPKKEAQVALCALNSFKEALPLLSKLQASGYTINAFECMDKKSVDLVCSHHTIKQPFTKECNAYALVEVEADQNEFCEILGDSLENNLILDVILAQNSTQKSELWKYREWISESILKTGTFHKNDISVSISQVGRLVEALAELVKKEYEQMQVAIFGHIGDGNLHFNLIKPARWLDSQFFEASASLDHKLFELIAQYKGSISAEHGVGLLKKEYLHYTRNKAEIEMMKSIKNLLDPNGLFNPGKIF